MRQKIVLRRRAVPLNITLPNNTTFAAKYERISRMNLPGNIRVTKPRTIGPRKKHTRKKKVMFNLANTLSQDRAKRIKKKYKKLRGINQTGHGILGDLVKLGVSMGSKAINSVFLYRYRTSKIKKMFSEH